MIGKSFNSCLDAVHYEQKKSPLCCGFALHLLAHISYFPYSFMSQLFAERVEMWGYLWIWVIIGLITDDAIYASQDSYMVLYLPHWMILYYVLQLRSNSTHEILTSISLKFVINASLVFWVAHDE